MPPLHTPRAHVTVEICVESLDAALAAQAGGAHRLELCANLDDGGTTPPLDIVAECVSRVRIPVFAMARVRPRSFVYTSAEVDAMCRQVEALRLAGAAGIVAGALRADATIDVDALTQLQLAAAPLPFTFHRAFDHSGDLDAALDALIAAGVARVLTSGGAPTAQEGASRLASLVARAQGRIAIMAGGTVRAANAFTLVRDTGVREVHARLSAAHDIRSLVDTLVT